MIVYNCYLFDKFAKLQKYKLITFLKTAHLGFKIVIKANLKAFDDFLQININFVYC